MERIYIITDRLAAGERFFPIIKMLSQEKDIVLQLREKDLSAAELYDMGKKIMKMSPLVKLVINDRLDVALALKAYGVQLTENSLTPDIVKSVAGGLKIGASVHSKERLLKYEQYCDFFVFGNVFETRSKPGVTGKGVFALKEITMLTKKPVYAIGGVTSANTDLVLKAGAFGVALKSPVFEQEYPLEEVRKIKKQFSVHSKT